MVYPDEVPIKETNPLRPLSPYAVSKVAQDMLGYQYWMSWKVDSVRTRGFNHEGPRRGPVFVASDFAKQIADIERGRKEPVLSVGNLANRGASCAIGQGVASGADVALGTSGLTPNTAGQVIRINLPPLTEERRRDLIRMARSMAEEGKVSVRNVRRDEMRDLHELRKEGEISQDDEHRAEEELQKLTDDYVKRVEAILADKEAELSEV